MSTEGTHPSAHEGICLYINIHVEAKYSSPYLKFLGPSEASK